MAYLSDSQKEQFWREGVLVVEDAVSNADLTALRTVFQEWVDESRDHLSDYGKHWMVEHGLTFNLAIAPRSGLRRVQSPEEVSPVFAHIMRTARTVDFAPS